MDNKKKKNNLVSKVSKEDECNSISLSEDVPIADFSTDDEVVEHKCCVGKSEIGTSLEQLSLLTDSLSSAFSDSDASASPRERKTPFERYSILSSFSLRQRTMSETSMSPTCKGILKPWYTESEEECDRRISFGAMKNRHKKVSICEENNSIRVFSADCGLDEQAARRKKNEKKRQKKSKRINSNGDSCDSCPE